MTKSRTSYPTSPPPSSSNKLGIGGTSSSHFISKLKPKIRIIHVYAPEIIKTDAANFRELVQRLTGKPEDEEDEKKGGRRRKTKTTAPPPKRLLDPLMIMEEQERECMVGLQKNGLRMKKEGEENDDNGKVSSSDGGGYLENFSEFDCFMEEFSTMPVV